MNARSKILFILLYYTGARVNELKSVTERDLSRIVETEEFSLILSKQKEAVINQVSPQCSMRINALQPEIDVVFKEYRLNWLGESTVKNKELMHEKAWIAYVNGEIDKVKEGSDDSCHHKSHSFRVGHITRGLKRLLSTWFLSLFIIRTSCRQWLTVDTTWTKTIRGRF